MAKRKLKMTKKAIAARRRYRARKAPVKKRAAGGRRKGRGRGRARGRGRGRGGGFWEDVGNGLLQVAGTVLPFIL